MRDGLAKILRRATGTDPVEPGNRRFLDRALQLSLSLQYRALPPGVSFDDVGFDVFSSTYEDGILLYLFSVIGFGNRRAIDIGAAGIDGSNVANLVVSHGFDALLIDANAEALAKARSFYESERATALFPPTTVSRFVTRDNVDRIVEEAGFAGPVDLLCIDIDGIDYWIYEALSVAEPRVVIVEYQDILGPDRAWTVPYREDFDARSFPVNERHTNYCGASLRAFDKLASKKGYRLVGTNRGGWNAFFVRSDLGEGRLPTVSVESCFSHPWNQYGIKERFPLVENLAWDEV